MIAGLTASIAGAVALAFIFWPSSNTAQHTDTSDAIDLPAEISQADYAAAKEQFEAAYQREANRDDVFSWLGESAFKQQRWEQAAASFHQISSDTPRYGHLARLFEGRTLLKLNRAPKAEENLREFLRLEQKDPQLPESHAGEALFQLDYLLGIELRFEDRRPVLRDILRLDIAEREEVMNYCFPSLLRWNGSIAASKLEEFIKEDPKDPRLRMALGRYRTGQGRLDEAREVLRDLRVEYPKSVSTAAALLACLYEEEAWNEMAEIVQSLPPPEDSHPWLLLRMRGHFHNHQGEFALAADCFQRVLKANPADAESWIGQAAAYAGMNNSAEQQLALERARQLSVIQNRAGWVLDGTKDPDSLLEVAGIAEDLGLINEALLVVAVGLKERPKHAKLVEARNRLQAKQAGP